MDAKPGGLADLNHVEGELDRVVRGLTLNWAVIWDFDRAISPTETATLVGLLLPRRKD
jgi:hypothetical protein